MKEKDKIKEIVYRAIVEVSGTDDPFKFEVKNDICYDIAYRAVEIALGEQQPSTAVDKLDKQQQPRTAVDKLDKLD